MTYESSSIRKLRDAMFAFNIAHPVRTIETLRVGMEAISQANPPAADLTVEPTELGGVAAAAITAGPMQPNPHFTRPWHRLA